MKFTRWNVLVFPSGIENGLEILESLRYCKEINLFAASSSGFNHSQFAYKNVHTIADISSEQWIDDLNAVIAKEKIDIVYVANSKVIDAVSVNRSLINTSVLLPAHNIIELTRSKKQTLKVLNDFLPTPHVYETKQSILNYPVFAKPDKGYGSQGAELISSEKVWPEVNFSDYIVQEYLPGKEYTVDCFSDYRGNLLFCSARERIRVRMGTSMHAENVGFVIEKEMNKFAKVILSKIPISGAWFFQTKADANGNLKLLEIDIRIAGTMCFNRVRGVNFPLMSIYDFFKKDIKILVNDQKFVLDRCLRNRYSFDYKYQTVYIDLDDTLIIRDKIVNVIAVQFLYQCLNKNKKIVLLSKSTQKDKKAYLKKFRLEQLFHEIFWLEEHEDKASYIHDQQSIFIDDSFSQRLDVASKKKIPTFDCSMLEGLLDDRYEVQNASS